VPRTAFILLCTTLLFVSCIKKKEVAYVSDETLIRQQLTQFEEALKQKNPDLFADYYARDNISVFPLWEREALSSWEEVVSYWQDFFNNHQLTEFSLSSVTVNSAGRVGWAKGNWQMKLEKKSFPKKKTQYFTLKGRYTAIFENKEGSWQAVHEHMSLADSNLTAE
jgi:ketosteroid isomerase-like protein